MFFPMATWQHMKISKKKTNLQYIFFFTFLEFVYCEWFTIRKEEREQ